MKNRLEIPNSCNQDWNKMSTLEQNRFCSKCQKEIFDFTSSSNSDILKILGKNDKVCGRLYQSQLNQNLLKDKKHFYVAKIIAIVGLGSILGISEPVQGKTYQNKVEYQQKSHWKSFSIRNQEKDSITIKGSVVDSLGKPLEGINVIFKNSNIGVATDEKGYYSIDIPESKMNKKNYLTFSFVGYKMVDQRFYKETRYLNVEMKEDRTVLIGEIIYYKKDNIFQKIGSFFHNIFSNDKTSN